MLRLISFILLLAMLPRFVTAMPVGAELCIADDHVRVDCHDAEPASDCDDEPTSDEPESQSCVDLPGGEFDARVSAAKSFGELMPCVVTLAAVAFVVPAPAIPTSHLRLDDPPRFCARAFTCSIALRC